jgi:hypothetical protein
MGSGVVERSPMHQHNTSQHTTMTKFWKEPRIRGRCRRHSPFPRDTSSCLRGRSQIAKVAKDLRNSAKYDSRSFGSLDLDYCSLHFNQKGFVGINTKNLKSEATLEHSLFTKHIFYVLDTHSLLPRRPAKTTNATQHRHFRRIGTSRQPGCITATFDRGVLSSSSVSASVSWSSLMVSSSLSSRLPLILDRLS